MSKTLIDVDDELLTDAAQALGTATKKDTVNRALGEAVALARRRQHLRRLVEGGLPDLDDPEVMAQAWR
ncbi:MAG: type II toxin-antitoxin system VapB family antitoxin [Nocardioidaceae bacterium]